MLKRLNLSSSILASRNKLWGKAVEPAKLEYTRGNQHVCPSCFTSCSKYPRRPSPSVSRHSRLSFTKGACKGLASAHKLAATISEQLETSNQSPLGYRDTMRDLAAVQIFRVAGVSFHNRQEPVNKLNADDVIMMVPEPENEHDEHAIAVKRLDGEMLGYVPKEENRGPAFKGRVLFGYVESVGSVLNKPYVKGFKAAFQPKLPPLHAVAAPKKLLPIIHNLEGMTDSAGYKNLSDAAFKLANGRCQISGASCKQLTIAPMWFEDTKQHTFVLQELICMAPQLKETQDSILQDSSPLNARTVQCMNGWQINGLQAYLNYSKALQKQREGEGWTVDTSLLDRES